MSPLTFIVNSISVTFIFTRFGFDGVSFLSSSLCVFCEVLAGCLHAGNDDSFQDEQSFKGKWSHVCKEVHPDVGPSLIHSCPADQERSGRECARAQRR